MREIKFRIWTGKKILYEEDIIADPVNKYFMTLHGIFAIKEPKLPARDSGFILLQYTGLKDKNGKEIYEGDIIRLVEDEDKEVGSVCFGKHHVTADDNFCSGDAYGWHLEYNNRHTEALNNSEPWNGDCTTPDNIEVIGNIYENGELL